MPRSCLLYRVRNSETQIRTYRKKGNWGFKKLKEGENEIFFFLNKMEFFSSKHTHTHTPHTEDGGGEVKKLEEGENEIFFS